MVSQRAPLIAQWTRNGCMLVSQQMLSDHQGVSEVSVDLYEINFCSKLNCWSLNECSVSAQGSSGAFHRDNSLGVLETAERSCQFLVDQGLPNGLRPALWKGAVKDFWTSSKFDWDHGDHSILWSPLSTARRPLRDQNLARSLSSIQDPKKVVSVETLWRSFWEIIEWPKIQFSANFMEIFVKEVICPSLPSFVTGMYVISTGRLCSQKTGLQSY